MSTFHCHGPVPLDHPLYRGRNDDLSTLMKWCRGEINHYGIVYGPRQSGKTSLFLRLEEKLSRLFPVCWIDFEYFSGATPAKVFTTLGHNIARTLHQPKPEIPIEDASQLSDYLCQLFEDNSLPRLILLLEELGSLPKETRFALANGLRAIFVDRVRPGRQALSRLMVIVSGNIELYDLAYTEVSPFSNICEKHYLTDLDQTSSTGLIIDGLSTLNVSAEQASQLGSEIYQLSHGYPYLVQSLGKALEQELEVNNVLDKDSLSRGLSTFLINDSALIKHIRKSLIDLDLAKAARDLLTSRRVFDRRDQDSARLELLGVALSEQGRWKVRNRIFQQVIEHWLNEPSVVREPLSHGLVRIFDADGKPAGSGFLVNSKFVITCAHVVTGTFHSAINFEQMKDVVLDFPLLAPGIKLWASIEYWQPYSPGTSNDMILLKLKTDLPHGAERFDIETSSLIDNHPFKACGFPIDRDDGVWAHGVIRSAVVDGRIQIEGVNTSGYRVTEGFSGGPVWDELEDRVAGMIVATDTEPEYRAAYMIPNNLLVSFLSRALENQT
jgi:hypothetical protein